MSPRRYITCRELIDFIGDYVEGTLDDVSRNDFERHLERCRSCQAYLKTYETTRVLTQAVLADDAPARDVPEELVRTILSRLN